MSDNEQTRSFNDDGNHTYLGPFPALLGFVHTVHHSAFHLAVVPSTDVRRKRSNNASSLHSIWSFGVISGSIYRLLFNKTSCLYWRWSAQSFQDLRR